MDNSAQRLLTLLEAAKAYPNPQHSAQSAWRAVFELDDALDIPQKLGALLVLSGQAAREVVEIDPATEQAVRHWRSQIFHMCTYGHGALWKEVAAHIDIHTLEYLRLQARLLEYANPTKSIAKESLDNARLALEDAIDEIRQSDLESLLKIRIIERIREIVIAIDNYEITGQKAVFDAFKLSIIDLGDQLSKNDLPGKAKLREGLAVIADLMNVASSSASLAPPVMQFLKLLTT